MSNSRYESKHRIGYVRIPGVPGVGHPFATGGTLGRHIVKENPIPVDVDIKNIPLPICPQCRDTKHVVNPQKGPYPGVLGCSKCEIEWNGYGQIFQVAKCKPLNPVL